MRGDQNGDHLASFPLTRTVMGEPVWRTEVQVRFTLLMFSLCVGPRTWAVGVACQWAFFMTWGNLQHKAGEPGWRLQEE